MKALTYTAIYTTLFALMFGGFVALMASYGSFQILDATGKDFSVMPFTTSSVAAEHAAQYCGKRCTVVRIHR